MKNKKIFIASVACVLGLGCSVMKWIKTGEKFKDLDERIEEVARCHNGLCLHTKMKIEDLEEQIEENREEIIVGLGHIESLADLLME